MNHKEPQFGERWPEEVSAEEKEDGAQERVRLTCFIKKIAERLRIDDKVPATEDCRIDMSAFGSVYSQAVIAKDMAWVREREAEEYPDLSAEEIKTERLKRDGEGLEMLKTAIFAKQLGQEFIVARTSRHDDENGVDNIILEKETGNIVCALDEVADTSGRRYQEKAERVLDRNRKKYGSGGALKYGFMIEKNKDGSRKLCLGRVENIPLFYLALPKRHLRNGLKEFIPSFEESSDYERKLFSYFTTSLSSQIDFLKLEQNLNPALKNRLICFEKTIKKLLEEKR